MPELLCHKGSGRWSHPRPGELSGEWSRRLEVVYTVHCVVIVRLLAGHQASQNLAACINEKSPSLNGRVPPHRPRERSSTEVYSSKLAPSMGLRTQLSGRPCPASS
eukprot:1142656-Pelagomonas_calceolata.AAC.6